MVLELGQLPFTIICWIKYMYGGSKLKRGSASNSYLLIFKSLLSFVCLSFVENVDTGRIKKVF